MGRIKYIDIAKGLLICCLIYGHMLIFARQEGIDDCIMPIIRKSIKLYNAFFMQTFFIITGFCSSFNKDFRHFLWGNVKSLIIPSYLLVLISYFLQMSLWGKAGGASANFFLWFTNGGPWFIVSLFWAKILYWLIAKLSIRQQFIVIGIIYAIGLTLNITNVIPNYSYHRHVMLMLPYLFVGHYCRNNMDTYNKWLYPLAIFGVLSISIQFIVSLNVDWYSIPTHDAHIRLNKTFYIHIINAITGSAFILWISSKIKDNSFLETLGQGTLLIYLWNGLINVLLLKIIPSPSESIFYSIVFHIFIYILMLFIFYFLIKVIYGSKYINWLVGKW